MWKNSVVGKSQQTNWSKINWFHSNIDWRAANLVSSSARSSDKATSSWAPWEEFKKSGLKREKLRWEGAWENWNDSCEQWSWRRRREKANGTSNSYRANLHDLSSIEVNGESYGSAIVRGSKWMSRGPRLRESPLESTVDLIVVSIPMETTRTRSFDYDKSD